MSEKRYNMGTCEKVILVGFWLAYLAIQGLCGWVAYMAVIDGVYWVAVIFSLFCVIGIIGPVFGLVRGADE